MQKPSSEIIAAKKAAMKKSKIIAKREAERADDVARNDMAMGLMPLFKAGVREGRRKEVVLKQDFAGLTVKIRGVELDSHDQDVLFGILAIALQQHDYDADTTPGSSVIGLKSDGEAVESAAIRIDTSVGQLLDMTGKNRGGAQVEAIRTSIERLSMIVVTVLKDKRWGSQHLISGAAGHDGQITVHLNWRLTSALLATGIKGGGSYASISMIERRALPPGVPRLVHAFLCTWRPVGGTGKITRGKLAEHIYGPAADDRKTQWRRMVAVGEALQLIGQLPGWNHITLPTV